MTNVEDVLEFHNKFQVPMAPVPSLLDQKALDFRVAFMHEELKEFEDSHRVGDLEGCADALVDLAYVVFGTALIMGLPWQPLWNRVQACNMTKRLAKPDGSDSKRKNPLDVVKPEGWVGPYHSDLLGLEEGAPPTFDATRAVLELAESRRQMTLC